MGERLATGPAALHPSHPGYAAAMKMSAMASQVVVILQQSGPKKRQPSHRKQSAGVTKRRLKPYMAYYHAMELIDPTAPARIPDGTWEKVKDICSRYNLSYPNVRSEIRAMRDDAVDLSHQEITMCKENLLKFYRDKYLSTQEDRRRVHLDSYAQVVFQLPFETVLIESLFSIMNYNKDKKRERLNDKSVASVIHTRDIPKVTKNITEPFTTSDLTIDLKCALDHRLKW